jgi:large subunit ribosomal protein L21
MYAIIEDSGTQTRVEPGQTIKLDARALDDDAVSLTLDRVLMIGGEDGEAVIGTPHIEGAAVEADILLEGRDEKIDVVKFKRRKGYRRQRGHRQSFIQVRITDIRKP